MYTVFISTIGDWMNLIRQYYDTNAVSKHEKKRAIIACEECHKENDVRFGYWLDCVKKDRKYCKVCSEHKRTEKLMTTQNQNHPLSSCLRIEYVGKQPRGLFKCSGCGSERWRNHHAKPYTQLCPSCSKLGIGQKHEVRHNMRLARIYRSMKDRCYNKNIPQYQGYGSVGITICKEWLDDRTKFYDWSLVNGYEDHLQIDKDKGSAALGISPAVYSPETCKWMTREENNLYKRTRTNTGEIGISLQNNGTFRLRNTHEYPQEKESQIFKTLDAAIETRNSSGNNK